MTTTTTPDGDPRELVITRLVNVSPEKLFRCWPEPALIVQWFTPPPWKTIAAEVDVRAATDQLAALARTL